jgi:hypothetical protein
MINFKKLTLLACYFSTSSASCSPIISVKHYSNADALKEAILNENKSKSGVYRFTNTINGKSYIGSSVNLRKRFHHYYSGSSLLRTKTTSAISNALLKYGYSNFTLEILEYCDSSDTIKREQHYIDLFNPEYNILSTAGSSLGHKHTEETKAKLRAISLNFSEETKKKIGQAQIGNTKRWGVGVGRVEVIDLETNEISIFSSMAKAGEMLGGNKASNRSAF